MISHNFNAVELVGLREHMVNRDHRQIDAYEKVWRHNHKIPDGAPSTLFEPATSAGEAAPAEETEVAAQ